MRRERIYLMLFILMVSVFTIGLFRLFALRFRVGDVYPAYSSLRSDPLGCRGVHDALRETGAVEVSRNFMPPAKIGNGDHAVLFYLGADLAEDMPVHDTDYEGIRTFLATGGTVVITGFPHGSDGIRTGTDFSDDESREDGNHEPKPTEPEEAEADPAVTEKDAASHWVFISEAWEYGCRSAGEADREAWAAPVAGPDDLPELPWYSALRFTGLSDDWTTVYQVDGEPVVVERRWEKGRILLAGDSYVMSNEALTDSRETAFLIWLIGDSRRVIFDEYHLGVTKQPGVVSVLYHFRLQVLVAVFGCLAVLFVWKNMSSLIPVSEMDTGETDAAGRIGVGARTHSAAMESLLKRHIRKENLLSTCLKAWEKSFVEGKAASGRFIPKARHVSDMCLKEETASLWASDPVAGYTQISRMLAEKEQEK